MVTKEGKRIVRCSNGLNCGTCMFLRTYLNTESLHEWDDPYCYAEGNRWEDMKIVTEEKGE